MNAFLVLVALVPALVLADVVPVQQCKSGGALPVSVDVEGCSKVPCQLVRGRDAVAHVDFTAPAEVTKLKPVVLATALGITVPFELPVDRQDACEWLEGSKCPLSEQEEARYELRLPVEKSYPPIAVDVQLQLVDQQGEVVSCFSVELHYRCYKSPIQGVQSPPVTPRNSPRKPRNRKPKMFKFLLVAALVPAMAMAAVSFTACPNGAPTPSTLTVNQCSGDVCILQAGQPLTATASGIVSPVGSNSANAHIVARVAGLDVGFEIPPELVNACAVGIQGGCPVVAGQAFTYTLNDPSLDAPARDIEVEIEVGLTGDGGVALGCLRFKARI